MYINLPLNMDVLQDQMLHVNVSVVSGLKTHGRKCFGIINFLLTLYAVPNYWLC